MPSLPAVRLIDIAPFMHTGVDCFGPMYVAQSTHTPAQKVYGVLFTCLVTRAIHVELARNLSGNEFLLCLDRFSSLRRVPGFLISDNGTNFVFVQPLVGTRVKLTDSCGNIGHS